MPFVLFVLLLGSPLATGLVTIDYKAQTFAIHKDALTKGVPDYSHLNQ